MLREGFTQRNFVADVVRLNLNFIQNKKNEKSPLSHHLGDFGVTYALHLYLVLKSVVHFLFVIIELFRYLLRFRRYKPKSVGSRRFSKGGHFERKFETEGALPTNDCRWQETRLIAISSGISKYPQCIVRF